jgi:hypothetical protein
MDKHGEFKRLYRRFIDGTRWLNNQMSRGVNVDKDKQEFEEKVVKPMDAMWATFTGEEKDFWNKVDMAVKIFDGRIVR